MVGCFSCFARIRRRLGGTALFPAITDFLATCSDVASRVTVRDGQLSLRYITVENWFVAEFGFNRGLRMASGAPYYAWQEDLLLELCNPVNLIICGGIRVRVKRALME
jgi:hypothetical protein